MRNSGPRPHATLEAVATVGLSLLLALSGPPAIAMAEAGRTIAAESDGGPTYGNLSYRVDDGSVTVTGCTDGSTSIEVPEQIDGLTVTAIGDYAFQDNASLASVSLPPTLTKIGKYAFSGCKALESIEIPGTYSEFGSACFSGCTALREARFTCTSIFLGWSMFDSCTSLTHVELPEGLESVSDYAFHRCTALEHIDIPDSVRGLGQGAFQSCTSLDSIDLPASLGSMFDYSFGISGLGCTSLGAVNVAGDNPYFHSEDGVLFHDLKAEWWSYDKQPLPRLVYYPGGKGDADAYRVPDGTRAIGDYAFCDARLDGVVIPASVEVLGRYAFEDNKSIRYVVFESGDTYVDPSGLPFGRVEGGITVVCPEGSEVEARALELGARVAHSLDELEDDDSSDLNDLNDLNDLARLRKACERSQREYDLAAAALAEAQEAYDEATAAYDRAGASVKSAADEAARLKEAWDAALAKADEADASVTEAQQKLDANSGEKAQAEQDLAACDSSALAKEVEDAEQRVEAAEQGLSDARAAVTAAQGLIDSETSDPGTNEGHEEWTALGLYRYIRDHSEQGSGEYWDAQCAIDVLSGGNNTTGHQYHVVADQDYEGPVPNGQRASQWASISGNVNLASRSDAVSLDNLRAALDYIDEYNRYRARENAEEGCSLRTDVGLNCRLMAIAAVQLDVSYDYASSGGHTQAYRVGENLSWGYPDPFKGWYEEEKADWKSGATTGVGHYMNIVDQLPKASENPTMATGFAVHTAAPTYGVAHGQVFHTTSGYEAYDPYLTYSTAEFRTRWLDPYYQEQVAAGMLGTTQEAREQHAQGLAAAQGEEAAAQSRLAEAKRQLEDARTALAGANANAEAARARLERLAEEGESLRDSLESAQAEAKRAHEAADSAKSDYDDAERHVSELDADGSYAKAERDLEQATALLEGAKDRHADAKAGLAAAVAELDDFTCIATSQAVRVSGVTDATYSGSAWTPRPVVTVAYSNGEEETLSEGSDYSVTYANNTNAGTATLTIVGSGKKGSGSWWGRREVAFAIKQLPSSIGLSDQSATYTGKAIAYAGAVTKTGSAGAVTYRYYKDAGRKSEVAASKVVDAGTYFVTATVAAKGNYAGATSAAAKLTVSKAASSVSLVDQAATYTGRAVAYSGKVTKTGSAGTVTYRYYSDAACTREVAAASVVDAGTYYVRATLAADANHEAATSNVARLTISKPANATPAAPATKPGGQQQTSQPAPKTKAANPMTAKASKKTVKLAKVKKKQTVKAITVKNAKGTVSYKVAKWGSKKAKKYLSVNKKTGKVTVKKGTPKGTYKVKVRVMATGNASYEAATKTVTVTVVVK